MNAVICPAYGPAELLQIQEVPTPEPKSTDVLIQVHTTTVSAADYRIRGANFPLGFGTISKLIFGFKGPRCKIIGTDFAGIVVKVGSAVTAYKPGDRVYGIAGMKMGAYAEYICLPESSAFAKIPDALTFNEAVALPFGGTTALYYLRDLGKVKAGDNILINGASGSVGTAAVQIAKALGAEVTAVCSGKNFDLISSLGADTLIDYTKEDITNLGLQFDIVLDCVGSLGFGNAKKLLTPNGTCLLVAATLPQIFELNFGTLFNNRKGKMGVAPEEKSYIEELSTLALNKKLTPVIDTIYPMKDIAKAHAYAEKGHKKGNVLISITSEAL